MNDITIYHNPKCGTSRNTLALIRHAGLEPQIIEYLKEPPSTDILKGLLRQMNLGVRDVLRQKGTPFDDLDLGNPKWSDAELLGFIEQHPILLNRPIVSTPLGARLCRPSEKVLEILPGKLPAPFTKEDGEVISGPGKQ